MASLLTSAAQGNENHTGIAARDTANSLKSLTAAVRGVAATTTDLQSQQAIIEAAKDVMEKSVRLLEEAKAALENPNNPENQQRLAQVSLTPAEHCLPPQPTPHTPPESHMLLWLYGLLQYILWFSYSYISCKWLNGLLN